jgi:hypothetical protein
MNAVKGLDKTERTYDMGSGYVFEVKGDVRVNLSTAKSKHQNIR